MSQLTSSNTEKIQLNTNRHSNLAELLLPELLVEVFGYCVSGPEDFHDSAIIRVNEQRARAPFRIAAVCATWRATAIAHSKLWHYVAIPCIDKPSHCQHHLEYIETVLKRSRDASIDVIFHFLKDDIQLIQGHEPLFQALSLHRWKWRRLCAVMGGPKSVERVLNLLTEPTPRLRTLDLSRQNTAESWTYRTLNIAEWDQWFHMPQSSGNLKPVLVYAPALLHVALVNIPTIWRRLTALRPTLISLDALQEAYSPEMWDVLDGQPQMEWIHLSARDDPPPIPTDRAVILPTLATLWLNERSPQFFAENPAFLRTPALKEIVLQIATRIASMRPYLTTVAPHLRALDIRRVARMQDEDVNALALLVNLQSLVFGSDALITQCLLLRMCAIPEQSRDDTPSDAVQILWPKLERFEIWYSSFEEHARHLLLDVVRVRGRPAPRSGLHPVSIDLQELSGFTRDQKTELEQITGRTYNIETEDEHTWGAGDIVIAEAAAQRL
ncbi:hypothetical protein BKA62DRAFT_452488 [Auriculariales sp. MPI-PUGE-AT-0066]|nr:hypothetical protein BKA62DRAFT_452488 [Auriculariales sp. MPI-PUGE-AT-0066]